MATSLLDPSAPATSQEPGIKQPHFITPIVVGQAASCAQSGLSGSGTVADGGCLLFTEKHKRVATFLLALTLAILLHLVAFTGALAATSHPEKSQASESQRVITLKAQTFAYVVLPLVVAFYTNPVFVTKAINEAFGILRQYQRPLRATQTAIYHAMIGDDSDLFGQTFLQFCSRNHRPPNYKQGKTGIGSKCFLDNDERGSSTETDTPQSADHKSATAFKFPPDTVTHTLLAGGKDQNFLSDFSKQSLTHTLSQIMSPLEFMLFGLNLIFVCDYQFFYSEWQLKHTQMLIAGAGPDSDTVREWVLEKLPLLHGLILLFFAMQVWLTASRHLNSQIFGITSCESHEKKQFDSQGKKGARQLPSTSGKNFKKPRNSSLFKPTDEGSQISSSGPAKNVNSSAFRHQKPSPDSADAFYDQIQFAFRVALFIVNVAGVMLAIAYLD